MSDCGALSDRMPDVALGRAQWTTDEERHLNDCGSCQREWELIGRVRSLGEVLGVRVPSSLVSEKVMRRLTQSREWRLRRRAWSFAAVAMAAAVALVVWTDREAARPASPTGTGLASVTIPLPELESLQPAELDSVLRSMDEPVAGSTLDLPDLGELESDELEHVLDSWEG